ncbi:MFS transporter [Lacticaseibacillus porcinae]|uniref:MFS transporter n=1 Tax=Lacticaseibacillus porcinae TaxID=1123687 RepID=UPI000F769BC9|nr:MFS transporter [Lacticaseibacillus porcinae]
MKKVAILSLSFFTVLTGAMLAPALPAIQHSYPDISAFWIQSLLTLPSASLLVMLFISRRLPGTKKQQVLVGLLIYLIGGLLPLMAMPFVGLAIARLISGFGLSLFAGPAISLIGEHYPEASTRRQLLGWASAVTSAGTVCAVSLAGWLVSFDWHWVFALYGSAIVPVILIWRWLPERPSTSTNRDKSFKLTGRLAITYGLNLFWNALYFVIPTTVPFYYQTWLHDSNPAHAGILMAGVSAEALVVGMNYAHIKASPQRKLITIFADLVLAGSCLLLRLPILTMMFAGLGVAMAMPVFNERVIAQTSPADRDHALSIGYAMVFAGQLVSPFIFSSLNISQRLWELTGTALVFGLLALRRRLQVAAP